VKLEDCPIDSGGDSEIIGIHDETGHVDSLSIRGRNGAREWEPDRWYDWSRPASVGG
jgi:hypothetical protein